MTTSRLEIFHLELLQSADVGQCQQWYSLAAIVGNVGLTNEISWIYRFLDIQVFRMIIVIFNGKKIF